MSMSLNLTARSSDTNGMTLGELALFVRRAQAAGIGEDVRVGVETIPVEGSDYRLLLAAIRVSNDD